MSHGARVGSRRSARGAGAGWRAGANEQAAHLPGVVGQAVQAACGAHPWPRGHRRRRALDDLVQPRALDARPAGRAHQEVDFAAFVFAQDDWTTEPGIAPSRRRARRRRATTSCSKPACSAACSACAAPSSCMRAAPSCPPTCSGLTCVRYDPRDDAGRDPRHQPEDPQGDRERGPPRAIEGLWWQFSLTARSAKEPSAVSLLRIARERARRAGARRPLVAARTARCRRATGARPRGEGRRAPASSTSGGASGRCDPDAPQLDGTGEITAGLRRPRLRLLHDPLRPRPEPPRPHLRRLPARRCHRPRGAGGRQRRGPRRPARGAAQGVEGRRERLLSGRGGSGFAAAARLGRLPRVNAQSTSRWWALGMLVILLALLALVVHVSK